MIRRSPSVSRIAAQEEHEENMTNESRKPLVCIVDGEPALFVKNIRGGNDYPFYKDEKKKEDPLCPSDAEPVFLQESTEALERVKEILSETADDVPESDYGDFLDHLMEEFDNVGLECAGDPKLFGIGRHKLRAVRDEALIRCAGDRLDEIDKMIDGIDPEIDRRVYEIKDKRSDINRARLNLRSGRPSESEDYRYPFTVYQATIQLMSFAEVVRQSHLRRQQQAEKQVNQAVRQAKDEKAQLEGKVRYFEKMGRDVPENITKRLAEVTAIVEAETEDEPVPEAMTDEQTADTAVSDEHASEENAVVEVTAEQQQN